MKRLYLLGLGFILTAATSVHAADFNTAQKDKSTLSFSYQQMGVNMDGHFNAFTVDMHFDPTQLATAKALLDINLNSIDTDSPEGNSEVSGPQWFNSKRFPNARFTANRVQSLGGNRYEISGPLSMKGRSQNITAPMTVTLNGNTAIFDGALTIKRADFAIGEGPWADFGTVANEVKIKFHIVALTHK